MKPAALVLPNVTRRKCASCVLNACACLSLLSATGCVAVKSIECQSVTTKSDNLPDCLVDVSAKLKRVKHAQPLVGLFVGVTAYAEESTLWSTPAHAVSAALFREPFYVSAGSTEAQARLALVTDLAINRNTSLGRATEEILRRMDGMKDRLSGPIARRNGCEASAPSVGTSGRREEQEPLLRRVDATTRDGMLRELDAAIGTAEATAQRLGRVVFILYISAHGTLGSDGMPYILPSDAIPGKAQTWIEQREIVARIGSFLALSRRDRVLRNAILVFDTCRHFPNDLVARPRPRPTRGLPNLILVESTSPRTYAYQWQVQSRTQTAINLKDSSWGFPLPPPKIRRPALELELASRISLAPLSSTCSIVNFFNREGDIGSGIGRNSYSLSAAHLSLHMGEQLDAFAVAVPEMQEKQERQQLQVHTAANQDWPLLESSK